MMMLSCISPSYLHYQLGSGWIGHVCIFFIIYCTYRPQECCLSQQFSSPTKMEGIEYFLILGLVLSGLIGYVCIRIIYKKWKNYCRKRELERFKAFIRDQVISTFHQQRQGENDDRFAVLIVATTKNLGQLSKMRFKRVKDSMLFFKDPLYDPSFPTYPPGKKLINYVVARAESEIHPA